MPLSPKMRFKLNRWMNKFQAWKAGARQTQQAVTAATRMCPACRALISAGAHECPYCGQRLQASGPVRRIARRAAPTIPVTGYLILANLVMFIIEYAVSGTSILTNLFGHPSQAATMRLGESLPLAFVVGTHQYWRWITACFLHEGLLHIGFNMWALYDIGPLVESFYGGAKYLFFYLATGVFGYFVSSYFGNFSLGASGAIFGILGVMIAYGVRRSHTAHGRELRSVAVRWAIYALILCFVIPGVDNFAHIGGLASGFGLGMIVGDDPPLTEAQTRRWQTVGVVMVVIVAAAFYFMAMSPIRLG